MQMAWSVGHVKTPTSELLAGIAEVAGTVEVEGIALGNDGTCMLETIALEGGGMVVMVAENTVLPTTF